MLQIIKNDSYKENPDTLYMTNLLNNLIVDTFKLQDSQTLLKIYTFISNEMNYKELLKKDRFGYSPKEVIKQINSMTLNQAVKECRKRCIENNTLFKKVI